MVNRDEILNILKNYKKNNINKYDIVELGLFGSAARNQASSNSDVDICIKTKYVEKLYMYKKTTKDLSYD